MLPAPATATAKTPLVDEADLLMTALRDGRRSRKQTQQQYNRLKAFDSNRLLDSEIYTESDITGLCSRIKRRKHADEIDLTKLGTAFLQSENHIAAFLNVIGAIDVIVKELTGTDRNQRILAAQCLCNMSLGSDFCCSKIASTAGVYLMICIYSSDYYFARICFWIVQNIASSGEKALNTLLSQELLGTCLELMKTPNIADEAHKLLDFIIDAKWETFSEEDRARVHMAIKHSLTVTFTDPMLLQIYLKTFPADPSEHGIIINDVIEMLAQTLMGSSHDGELTYFIARTLIQLCHDNRACMAIFAKFLPVLYVPLASIVNNATTEPKLFPAVHELMHLVSLFYKEEHQALPSVVNFRVANLRPEDLCIPKLFEF